MNREEWLSKAIEHMTPIFTEKGLEAPVARVTNGWPSKNGRPGKKQRLGECWYGAAAGDGVPQIFITPLQDDSLEVLGTLAHELVHVVAGSTAGHKAAFRKAGLAIGLQGASTVMDPLPRAKGTSKRRGRRGTGPVPSLEAAGPCQKDRGHAPP